MSRSKDTNSLFPVLGRISRMFDRMLTGRGKVAVAATIFFLVGSIHVDSPIYYLCGASLSVLFVSFVSSRFFRPTLEYSISTPAIVTAGIPFRPRLDVRNIGRNGYDMKFDWLPSRSALHRFHLDSQNPVEIKELNRGEQISVSLPLTAYRRGIFSIPAIQTKTSFPFDLFLLSDSYLDHQKLVIAPAFKPLVAGNFLAGFFARELGDARQKAALGEQEFVGSREFVPGLPGRRWDYRAWARTGKPHLRQHEAYCCHMVNLLIDTSQTSPDANSFEAMISLSMAIADYLVRQPDQQLGSLTVGNSLTPLPRDDRVGQRAEICRQLAVAKPSNPSKDCLGLAANFGQSLILLTTEMGTIQQTFVNRQLSAGANLVVILVNENDKPPAIPVSLRSTVKLMAASEIAQEINAKAVEI